MIDLYSASSNLGDNLSLTPLMRATPCRVHLIDDEAVRSVAPIFDGLGDVVYDNDKRYGTGNSVGVGPHSARFLKVHGLGGNAIPSIKLTEEEVNWARAFMADFDLSKTCVVKATTSQVNYRTPPDDLVKTIMAANQDTVFLTSSLTSSHPKNNFHHVPLKAYTMWDYPIRRLAAIYHLIGRYVGPDSGDYHLMLAVGGKADVLVPDSIWHYDHQSFHYRDIDYAGAPIRTRYHHWSRPFGASLCGLVLPSTP